jgi:hypothetical protein
MNTNLPAKFLFFCLAFSLMHMASNSSEFYISPGGNDHNSGNSLNPFATLTRAMEAVKEAFQQEPDEDCTVWLSYGLYQLSEPIVIKSEDLKNRNGKLIFRGMPGTEPIISGGIQILEWEKFERGIWMAKISESFMPPENVRELFAGNKRATRARFPNEGYLRIKEAGADRRTHFYFNTGDFPVPANVENIELVLLHDWSVSRIPVKEIDVSENKLTAVDSIGAKNPAFFNLDHWEPDPRYFLENAMEFLDADYEWFFDASQQTLFLKLPGNLHPDMLEIFMPVSEGLIMLKGKENRPIKNIHFEGITFRHSSWTVPGTGYCGVQACHYDPRPQKGGWAIVPAAVMAEWAEKCSFNNCNFENLGGSGLWFAIGCRNCSVTNSLFTDISGNGIKIGEGRDREIDGKKWWKVAPEQVASGNKIENCYISDCGKQFYGAVGIWCGLIAETTIRRNKIYNLPYTGISVGWMWSAVPTPCCNNLIEENHIHHIMQILSDGGGIYMLGLQPGSKIRNNQIHDVSLNAGRAESNGMFLDEGTTDVIVSGNLIYNIAKSPLRFHKATTNRVENNYLFCSGDNPPVRYNNTKETDIQKLDNKIYFEKDDKSKLELFKAIVNWERMFQ